MFSEKDIPERYFLKVIFTLQISTNPHVQKKSLIQALLIFPLILIKNNF